MSCSRLDHTHDTADCCQRPWTLSLAVSFLATWDLSLAVPILHLLLKDTVVVNDSAIHVVVIVICTSCASRSPLAARPFVPGWWTSASASYVVTLCFAALKVVSGLLAAVSCCSLRSILSACLGPLFPQMAVEVLLASPVSLAQFLCRTRRLHSSQHRKRPRNHRILFCVPRWKPTAHQPSSEPTGPRSDPKRPKNQKGNLCHNKFSKTRHGIRKRHMVLNETS